MIRLSKQIGLVCRPYMYRASVHRTLTYSRDKIILGIETSCDDTGCAVISGTGSILGEALYSQNIIHTRYGGVNPLIAHELHRENIENCVEEALNKANLTIQNIDAIAVTTKPGLLISLQVGVKYARYLSKKNSKPLIPVHHMEAHALVARMYEDIKFPFITLLISGGHCLIAHVKDVDDIKLLGKSLDNAPGEILDKIARRLKLRNIPEYSKLSGGRAIELAAQKAKNPSLFDFPSPLLRYRDCNFSFSGLQDSVVRKLLKKESEHGIMGDEIIPEVYDMCAAIQRTIAEHLVHRTHRAILFCEKKGWITQEDRRLVISGGVACNNFIFNAIKCFGEKCGYRTFRPPPKVCTDNGIMIAWNGLEKLKSNYEVKTDISLNDIDPSAPLGLSFIDEVIAANIQTKVTRLKNIC